MRPNDKQRIPGSLQLLPLSPDDEVDDLESLVDDLESLDDDLESLDDDLESLDDVADEPDELSAGATFFLPPDLKSVSYQPPPFKRKPAADIFFFNPSAAHSGQLTSGASLIFCKTSSS